MRKYRRVTYEDPQIYALKPSSGAAETHGHATVRLRRRLITTELDLENLVFRSDRKRLLTAIAILHAQEEWAPPSKLVSAVPTAAQIGPRLTLTRSQALNRAVLVSHAIVRPASLPLRESCGFRKAQSQAF